MPAATLLDDFEASPPADEHDEVAQRHAICEQSPSDQLVDCIVPPDVLAKLDKVAMHIKERGSVQAAGAIEDWLVGAQRLRQPAQHLRRRAEVEIGRAQATITMLQSRPCRRCRNSKRRKSSAAAFQP